LQAGKTTMDLAMDAYIEKLTKKGKFIPTDKQSDAALACFNVVNENGGIGFSGEVKQLFAPEVIADAKKPLAKEMRDKRTVCKKAKRARDKTQDEVKKLSSEIDVLKDEINGLDTQHDKESQVIAARKQLATKNDELTIKKTKLDTQNDALGESCENFAKAYNRYHQAKCLSESEIEDWEDIVTAEPLSKDPSQENDELTAYRRGMLNPEDTGTIEDIMDDFNEYRLTPIDQFDKNNTYKTIQAYAQKANDQYIRQANDTPDVNVDDTVGNATTEMPDLGIDTPDPDSSETMVPPPHTETSRQKSLDEASSLVNTNLENAKDAVENAEQEPTPITTAGKNDQDNATPQNK
jgi:hypothetical protein